MILNDKLDAANERIAVLEAENEKLYREMDTGLIGDERDRLQEEVNELEIENAKLRAVVDAARFVQKAEWLFTAKRTPDMRDLREALTQYDTQRGGSGE